MMMRVPIVGLLWALIAVLPAAGQSSLTGDQNSDGRPDQWIEIGGKAAIAIRSDRNFDGVVDHLVEMDSSERKLYEEFDFNYDGKMDDFYYYKAGVLERQEVDSDFDGRIDLWVFLSEGMYIRRLEQDTDGDGAADLVQNYESK